MPRAGELAPIAVDLDGTLIRTDLLLECAKQFFRHRPLEAPKLAVWLWHGKSYFKARLSEYASIQGRSLPFNAELVDWLRQRKAEGRLLVLATASYRPLAVEAVAHLGLFDEILATETSLNLKGEAKRDALVQRFGACGYEYVGNEPADFAIWACASAAHVVTSSARFAARVRRLGKPGCTFRAG